MVVTDVHRHFVPNQFFRFIQSQEEYGIKVLREEDDTIDIQLAGTLYRLNRSFFDARPQIEGMDQLGIDHAIVSLATPMVNYYLDPGKAREAARLCNDGFAELTAAYPERFSAWAFLPMQDPEFAADELRRCITQHGFVGGHVATNVSGSYLPDRRFRPIFDAALDLDVPLFVHPVNPAGQERTAEYELTVIAGYLFDSTINILRMMCSGFLDELSPLKLICAHTGAFSIMLRARMQREIDTNPTLSATVPQRIGDYLRRLYFDSVCFEPGYLQLATTIVPVENILLGSDSPFLLGEPDPVNFVRNSLSADAAEKVLGANFQKLLERRSSGLGTAANSA